MRTRTLQRATTIARTDAVSAARITLGCGHSFDHDPNKPLPRHMRCPLCMPQLRLPEHPGLALSKFTVIGELPFPIDMLREDTCWPATVQDAQIIEESFAAMMSSCEVRRVTVLSLKQELNAVEWKHLGWKVITT